TWNTDFAISRPTVLTSPMDGSPHSGLRRRNHPLAHRCRRVGAVHSIIFDRFNVALRCPVESAPQNRTSEPLAFYEYTRPDTLQGGVVFIGRVRRGVLKYFVVVLGCGFIRREFGYCFQFFLGVGA